MKLHNLFQLLPGGGPQDLETTALGALAGSEKLYVNLDRIPPGLHSTLYHSHSLQEEFFLVLEGGVAEDESKELNRLDSLYWEDTDNIMEKCWTSMG